MGSADGRAGRRRGWLRGTGEQHHVLQLTAAERNGLGRISFAVEPPAEIDAAARRLEARGIAIVAGPGPTGNVGGGYGVAFVDLEGRIIELTADTHAVPKLHREDAVRSASRTSCSTPSTSTPP